MSNRETPRNPSFWTDVRRIFREASALPPDAQQDYVHAATSDPEQRAEVQQLISAHADSNQVVEGIISDAANTIEETSQPLPIERLGHYRILRRIGEGGMGTVYLAERADNQFQQKVAIKVVDQRRPTTELLARFRQERQILANLDHPNIARLLDGGETESGLPYLVMEYIDGIPITEFCDRDNMSIAARLSLMVSVCGAVQYAHQNLIIHRDIKPSNILVGNNGIPKLLDFGIAKLLQPENMQQTVAVTMESARLLTPGNASPEQVRGDTITTASDVYSLGVLLYELLTGQFPYEITGHSPAELERVICETSPSKPSDQFSSGRNSSSHTQRLTETRKTTRSRLNSRLKGDLDNIVLFAMRKEPERRYESARELQQDISNYLQNRPIIARRETLPALGLKFLRRNRWAVVSGTAFLSILVAVISVYTIQLADERDRAVLEATKSAEVRDFLAELFSEADPSRNLGEPLSAKQLLDRGASRITQELSSQPDLQAALMATIGQSYYSMSDIQSARAHLENAVAIAGPALGPENEDVLQLKYLLAMAKANVGEFDDAIEIHTENYQLRKKLSGSVSLEAARELLQIAYSERELGELERAEPRMLESIAVFRNFGSAGEKDLASALLEYSSLLRRTERVEEEEAGLLEALQIQARRVGTQHPQYVDVVNNIGNFYYRRGDFSLAAQYMQQNVDLRKTLNGEKSTPYGLALSNYANLINSMGKFEEALAMTEEALTIFAARYGLDSNRYAFLLENKANILMNLERFDDANPVYLEVLSRLETIYGKDNQEYAFTQSNYGNFLLVSGKPGEAIPLLASAVTTFSNAFGNVNRQTIGARMKLARALMANSELDRANTVSIESLDSARELFVNPHRLLIEALRTQAEIQREMENFEVADEIFRETIAVTERIEDRPLMQAVTTEIEYAKSLFMQDEKQAAEKMLRDRHTMLVPLGDTQEENRNEITEALDAIAIGQLPD